MLLASQVLRERVAAGRKLAEAIAAALPPPHEGGAAAGAAAPAGQRSRRVKSEYSSLSKGRSGSAGGSSVERGPGAVLCWAAVSPSPLASLLLPLASLPDQGCAEWVLVLYCEVGVLIRVHAWRAGSELTTAEGLRALQAQVAAAKIGVPEQDALEAAVQTLEDFQVPSACSGTQTLFDPLLCGHHPVAAANAHELLKRKQGLAGMYTSCCDFNIDSSLHVTMQARCRELAAQPRPALEDLEALAARAEDLPGIVHEYEPLGR